MVFSDTSTNLGILQRARKKAKVDSTQWATSNVVGSCNDWLNHITRKALTRGRKFAWDDTNHTGLPEGTDTLTINVSDYSFLTDQHGNRILTLTGVSILRDGKYVPLKSVDRRDPNIDIASFGTVSGIPSSYDKLADNVIRLDYLPPATVALGIKYYFQRSPSYITASDTTKEPGVALVLHEGFVIKAAYDAAETLGLDNLGSLSIALAKEEQAIDDYFNSRDNDDDLPQLEAERINSI